MYYGIEKASIIDAWVYCSLVLIYLVYWGRLGNTVINVLVFICCILAYWADRVAPLGVCIIILMGFLCYGYYVVTGKAYRFFLGSWVFIVALLAKLHLLPGFNNLKILDNYQLSIISAKYNLYFNFDVAIIGILMLCYLRLKINGISYVIKTLIKNSPLILVAIAVMICLSLAVGLIQFDLKVPPFLFIWFLLSFLAVAVEEIIFRGWLLKELSEKYGNISALFLTSTIFCMLHYHFGFSYMLMAFVAGFFYGAIYIRTNSLEVSIISHLLLNFTHIMLFTYPARLLKI